MTSRKKRSGGTPRTTAATTAAKDRSGIEAALAAEGVQAGSASGAAATPEGPVQQALLAAYRELTTRAEEYQRCAAALDARRADADRQAEAAEQDRTAAARELTEARTWRAEADEERAELDRRQAELDALAEGLAERERQADNGFAERDQAAVAALTAELEHRRSQFDQEYTTRESDLDRRGADIDRRERELTGLGTELRLRERALDDRADTIDAEIRAAAAQQVNAAQLALDTAVAEAEPLRWEIDKLRSKVGEQARQLVALGHTDAADLMQQMEHAKLMF